MTFQLDPAMDQALRSHAQACFPAEACGFVVRREGARELVCITNVQDEKHAADPERYPRTSATAYTMGPEAAAIMIDHERGRLVIEGIFHSHPQHDAYFSAEDKMQATVWDEPSYPDASQIVVSVYDGIAKTAKAFHWNDAHRDFLEIPLVVASDQTTVEP